MRKLFTKRRIVIMLFIIILLLIWAELGVGIFGTPWAGD
jgi:hypothetical protein|tara:strand:+ start:1408 stop:1524 length:117 start_codon:yes stop_codon:yes gene_type:complete